MAARSACDRVRYRPRGGALIHWLFVRRDVERIFQYRQQRLREYFATLLRRVPFRGAQHLWP